LLSERARLAQSGSSIIPEGGQVMVPTGYAEQPREILTPPKSLVERMYANIQRWTRMPRAGHFPALEAPAALADDIHAFFRAKILAIENKSDLLRNDGGFCRCMTESVRCDDNFSLSAALRAWQRCDG
jgi:hypothetical protein